MEPDKLFQTMYDSPRQRKGIHEKRVFLKFKHREISILPPLWGVYSVSQLSGH
jgi:hypothetical protein